MSAPDELRLVLPLRLINTDTHDGSLMFLSDGKWQAIGRWRDDAWHYPDGEPLEFAPTHARSAVATVTRAGALDG